MNEKLPPSLTKSNEPDIEETEETKDIRFFLEEIAQQNAEILRRLRGWYEDDDTSQSTIGQIFDAIFSFYGAIIIIVVCGALAAIFSN